MAVELIGVRPQRVEEVHLGRDVQPGVAAGLYQGRDEPEVDAGGPDGLPQIGLRPRVEVLGGHGAQVVGVKIPELFNVEDRRGLGDAADVENLRQLAQREELPLGVLAPGGPAQQGHVVLHRLGQIALGDEVLVGGVAVALAHLVVRVPHDGGAVDVGGHGPAEALVQQVVLGRGGEVLAAPYHVGDAHQVVVHHVGEIVGGQAVGLDEHLVVQGGVLHRDVAEDHVVEGGLPLRGDFLPDDIGNPRRQFFVYLSSGELPAAAVVPAQAVLAVEAVQPLLGAKAAVGVAPLYKQLGVSAVEVPPLGLDVGPHGAAQVGTLVPVEAALAQGLVDDLGGALHKALLVGVLDAQDEFSPLVPGDKPGVQGGAQVADVHIAGGGGGEAGPHLSSGDARLHVVKPCFIQR